MVAARYRAVRGVSDAQILQGSVRSEQQRNARHRRAMTGPEWVWAALSGSPRSTRNIGFALRLAHPPLRPLPFRKLFVATSLSRGKPAKSSPPN